MFGFVSVIEYNHLKKLRNEIFLEKEEIAHRCKIELQKKDEEINKKDEELSLRDDEIIKLRKLYLDELQRNILLAEQILVHDSMKKCAIKKRDEV